MANTATKRTKVDNYNDIKAILENQEDENVAMLIEFIDEQITQITNKAEKAKARAAEKKAEGDALRERIYDTLTSEWQSISEISAQLNEEDVTPNKISARLGQLFKLGMIDKSTRKNESTGNKQTVYCLVATEAAADEVTEVTE